MNDISCDVLVVGAGLAGFTAAVRASEHGSKVLLIDKSRGELGDGNVLMARAVCAPAARAPRPTLRNSTTSLCPKGRATPTSSKPGRKIAAAPSGGYKLSVSRSKRPNPEKSG